MTVKMKMDGSKGQLLARYIQKFELEVKKFIFF